MSGETFLHLCKSSVPIVMHHLVRMLWWGCNRTDHRWRVHLRGSTQYSCRRPIASHCGLLLYVVDNDTLLMDVFHVGLQVSLLLELFGTEVAIVLVIAMTVNPNHVPSQTSFAFKLFGADIAIVTGPLMFGLDMHISAASWSGSKFSMRKATATTDWKINVVLDEQINLAQDFKRIIGWGLPEFLPTPLAWVQLGHVVNGVDVTGDVGRTRKWLITNFAFVLCVLVFGFRMNSQARLWFVTFATIHTLVRGLLRRVGRNLAPFLVNFLDVTLQTWLLRKSSLAKWTNQQRVLVLQLHVRFDGRLCCEDLK